MTFFFFERARDSFGAVFGARSPPLYEILSIFKLNKFPKLKNLESPLATDFFNLKF